VWGPAAAGFEHGPQNGDPREVIRLTSTVPLPAALPAPGSSARWPWLRQLRGCDKLDPTPWVAALESGAIDAGADLLAVLAERFDPPIRLRLLRWWRQQPDLDPAIAALLARDRDPSNAAWLRQQLLPGPAGLGPSLPESTAQVLLPLLGHQRQPDAWPVLLGWVQAPVTSLLRRAALEGVALGLSAWPRLPLARALSALATDLEASLAATAVDLLARLPDARRWLVPLRAVRLDPAVAERVGRRLAAIPPTPLLLVVHGRTGGELPAELVRFAAELERRRGAPVRLQALTAVAPPLPAGLLRPGLPLTLVPLLLLPGGHVRHDLPAISNQWRRFGPVRRLPFLGAWPSWQVALRRELAAQIAAKQPDSTPGPAGMARPLLLHHPLEGPLAARYLAHLERFCGARALPGAAASGELDLLPPDPLLPLALATSRLTECHGERVGPPLLQRPNLRALLLEDLEALP